MAQEEKQKLFIALCGYLPYGVKCNINGDLCKIERINIEHQQFYLKKDNEHGGTYSIVRGDVIKPYLRPMSSMTEEERSELRIIWHEDFVGDSSLSPENLGIAAIYTCHPKTTDFYLSHYFDYRGLIEKGLAIEAPEGMYSF